MTIEADIKQHLAQIEKDHKVTIILAVESGSRAWGFASPDSDYDVRFIYAHPYDWYVQLHQERDVIELPINDELDISGWDVGKTLSLANGGNAVAQEWLISPIVYRQHTNAKLLQEQVNSVFNPISCFHHYRSTAKKVFEELKDTQQIKVKRFFYFARAVLSARWIMDHQTMPSIEFQYLLDRADIPDTASAATRELIEQKSQQQESWKLNITPDVLAYFMQSYESLDDSELRNLGTNAVISNTQFQTLLKSFQNTQI